MDWQEHRLSRRLALTAETTEHIYSFIAEIDAVRNSWRLTNRLMPQIIERLMQSVLVTSTGASNRIEGNRLTDEEVQSLYKNMRIRRLATRDEQEVAGYLDVLQCVFENYSEMPLSESIILQLHRDMLRHSDKDAGHLGHYKVGPNRVEAKDASGNIVGVIFDPTPPYLVPIEMKQLCAWYEWAIAKSFKHPLIVTANFIFEYLAIHPFQDGNGRTSRILTNLLLLRHGYAFATVASHERIVEESKAEYYLALNRTQRTWKTEQEDISPWLAFIFEVFRKQASRALQLLEEDQTELLLSEKQLALWRWAQNVPEEVFSPRMAVQATGFPVRTVEDIIKKLSAMNKLERTGLGRGTRYRVKASPRKA
ncbi:MAG TPA: Fic family protein [Capsulimonadaceae bacterium]|jgi:Fic family protein